MFVNPGTSSLRSRLTYSTVLFPQRRHYRPAVPFLIDEPYRPSYLNLSPELLDSKRKQAFAELRNCKICPRRCGVNRYERVGLCLIPADAIVDTIAAHFGEEACLQGTQGSGTVFFSGCNLRCVFCQNWMISHQRQGVTLKPNVIAEWMIKLQNEEGCHNINLVTPEHVVPQVVLAIIEAAEMGLRIPIIYNTGSYDLVEGLELLDGLVDIYLADMKFWNAESAKRYVKAGNYPQIAKDAIKEMNRQVGPLLFSVADGLARRGLLLRHLLMPGHKDESASILKWIANEVDRDTYISLMSQYHPDATVGRQTRKESQPRYSEINRPVRSDEYTYCRQQGEAAGLWRWDD